MKADLHVHTCHSNDGVSTVEQVLAKARAEGFGCVAITDHNSFDAFAEASGCADIIVIPAEEVSSKDGHILAFGIDRHIPRDMSIIETIDLIHAAGGYAFAAHPYRWWSGLGEKNVIPEFDGVEALNGRSTKGCNRKSLALSQRLGKPVSAGSDDHTTQHFGEGYVDIPDSCRTWQDVVEALMQHKAVPHSSNRNAITTLKYGFKSITQWIMRGFKRM